MNGAPLVCVEWRDITSHDRWESLEDVLKTEPAVCSMVGWLIHDSVSKIVLVHGHSEGEVCGYHVIPKGCVVRTTKLETGSA